MYCMDIQNETKRYVNDTDSRFETESHRKLSSFKTCSDLLSLAH